MNAELLLTHYERVAEAPDAIQRLRELVLDIAIQGKATNFKGPWRKTTLAELGAWGSGGTPSKSHPEYYGGDIPWLVIGDLNDGIVERSQNSITEAGLANSSAKLIAPGTVLIAMYGSIGKLGIAGIECATNQAIAYCVPAEGIVTRQYLFWLLRSLRKELLGRGQGIAQQNISQKILKAWPVQLPPLAEQHRIVAKVDELMALCDQLETAQADREMDRDKLTLSTLAKLNEPDPETFADDARFALEHLEPLTKRTDQIKQLRQTILNLAVRGKLVEQDPRDEPAAALFQRVKTEKARMVKAGIIPRPKESARDLDFLADALPASWLPIALGDVCSLVTSGSRGWGEYYAETGPGFVRAQNIRFGKLRLDGLACVNPPAKSEGARTQVAKGDLLIVITGAGVTNPALLDVDLGEAYVSQHVGLVRPCDTELSPWLLLCLMADAGGRAELTMRAYGAGKPGLNLDNIRSLSVPLPPIAEQHRIVAKVDALMELCDQLEASLIEGEQTRSKLLEAVLHEALEPA